MRKIKALFCVLFACLLCGCGANTQGNNNTTVSTTENITDSNKSTTEEYSLTTTEPVADPIASYSNLSNKLIVWGPGNIENHQQPSDPVSLQNSFSSLDADWLLNDDKSICLTFDEGYENGYTPSILDTLKQKKVKAIFFVTYDFAEANPDLIKRMIDEGHVVANHSWHHYSMPSLDDNACKEEINYLHQYMLKKFNYTMSYFRFPAGEFSSQNLAVVKDLGYKSVFWSFAYQDWDVQNQPNENEALQKICESTHPGEIMLLHAVSEVNANILPKVIDDIRQQGYKFTVKV